MKATSEIVVDRPVQQVWEYVSNIENLGHWVNGVMEPRWTGGTGKGATFASKYMYRGKEFDIAYEVTEFEPQKRFSTRSTSGPFPYQGDISLTPSNGGTRVSNTVEAGADSFVTKIIFAVAGWAIRPQMRKDIQKELVVLKRELESA